MSRVFIKGMNLDLSKWLPYAADRLPLSEERYDLIFSCNVLEHMEKVDASLSAMQMSLAPRGIMRHNLPNYFVPYDPHFSLLLVPFFPQLTTVFNRSLRENDLWKGVNFISSFDLIKLCRKLKMEIVFDKDFFEKTLTRLEDEPIFQKKHKFISRLYSVLKGRGLNLMRWGMGRWLNLMKVGLDVVEFNAYNCFH